MHHIKWREQSNREASGSHDGGKKKKINAVTGREGIESEGSLARVGGVYEVIMVGIT